jgi:hypothetical protein
LADSFGDICNCATVVIPSTNPNVASFCDYKTISLVFDV